MYVVALGNIQEQPSSIVIVTAYVFNNVRPLLHSQMGTPYDPQTGKGVVGKNYCYQVGSGGSGSVEKGTIHPRMGSGAASDPKDALKAGTLDTTRLRLIRGRGRTPDPRVRPPAPRV